MEDASPKLAKARSGKAVPPGRRRCLTIESEERETWTAEVLADTPSQEGVSKKDTLTVTFPDTGRLRRMALSIVFGTRQDEAPSGAAQMSVTSQESIFQLESLILAQNERWRQA